jgi:DNA-directed RNA polymerase specialized sigma subunit
MTYADQVQQLYYKAVEDEEYINDLLRKVKPYVYKILNEMGCHATGYEIEDFAQEALMATVEAFKRYSEDKSKYFLFYAALHIKTSAKTVLTRTNAQKRKIPHKMMSLTEHTNIDGETMLLEDVIKDYDRKVDPAICYETAEEFRELEEYVYKHTRTPRTLLVYELRKKGLENVEIRNNYGYTIKELENGVHLLKTRLKKFRAERRQKEIAGVKVQS